MIFSSGGFEALELRNLKTSVPKTYSPFEHSSWRVRLSQDASNFFHLRPRLVFGVEAFVHPLEPQNPRPARASGQLGQLGCWDRLKALPTAVSV